MEAVKLFYFIISSFIVDFVTILIITIHMIGSGIE